MACISIGKIDINLIPILAGCIFCFLNRILTQYDGSLLFENPVMHNILISSSKLFTIIPYIILKLNSKGVKSSDIQTLNKSQSFQTLQTKYETEKKRIIKGKWCYIISVAIIFLVNQILYVLTIKAKSNTSILNILITSLFYYLIFKIKLFKHHYLSVILIILIGIVVDIVLGNLQYDINNNFILIILRILREATYSLSSVIDKYIMEKKFGSPYEILLANGLITSPLLIIFALIDYYFIGIDNYKEYFNNFNVIELLVVFGVIITQLGLNLCILLTNKNNSPCHIFIIFIFGQLAYYIDFTGISILVIFCLIFILFLSFIFNEIIEINLLGLSDNTRKNISKRAEMEDIKLMTECDLYDRDLEEDGYIIYQKDFKPNEIDESSQKNE